MFSVLILSAVVAGLVSPVHAATFGDMFSSIGNSVNALGSFARVAFAVLGFACLGIGIVNLRGARMFGIAESPDSKIGPIGKFYWILAGAGLLCLSAFGMMASESMGLSTGNINF
jgi:hypothetical protein